MIRHRHQTFALVIPRFEDIFHSFYAEEIIKGVGQAASRLQTDILMHITDKFDHSDWINASLLGREYIDGIIFADINSDVDTLQKVINTGIPYIVLNNEFVSPVNSISINNKEAAFRVTEFFINQGHKRIATIAGDLYTQAGKMRLDGYKEALSRYGIPLKEEYVAEGGFLRSPARESAKQLLDLKERPTAVFAASDVMALELIDEARKHNIFIPEDLSVVGFDDNPLNTYSPIKLSTVYQPLAEMGRLGMEHLNQICHQKKQPPVKISLETQFISRDSTKVLNSQN